MPSTPAPFTNIKDEIISSANQVIATLDDTDSTKIAMQKLIRDLITYVNTVEARVAALEP